MQRVFLAAMAVLLLGGCDTAYYGAWEKLGVYKSDILVDRVQDAMQSQQEAKEEFKTAFERFESVVAVDNTSLKKTYQKLNSAFEDAEEQAADVSDRIDSVEDVSKDLFREWEGELKEISNAQLRSSSQRQLRESKSRYGDLIRSMRAAESRMAPVLTAFKDHVLFLKHNLNAQAISSLKGELGRIETNVDVLIKEMEASIEQSQDFIKEWKLVGESA